MRVTSAAGTVVAVSVSVIATAFVSVSVSVPVSVSVAEMYIQSAAVKLACNYACLI